MTRSELISLLQARRADFQRLDVASLSLFGSFARDEAAADSDIDVLVRFATSPTFDRFMDLKFMLESVTGRKVDLVTDDALRPEIRDRVVEEAVHVA